MAHPPVTITAARFYSPLVEDYSARVSRKKSWSSQGYNEKYVNKHFNIYYWSLCLILYSYWVFLFMLKKIIYMYVYMYINIKGPLRYKRDLIE